MTFYLTDSIGLSVLAHGVLNNKISSFSGSVYAFRSLMKCTSFKELKDWSNRNPGIVEISENPQDDFVTVAVNFEEGLLN